MCLIVKISLFPHGGLIVISNFDKTHQDILPIEYLCQPEHSDIDNQSSSSLDCKTNAQEKTITIEEEANLGLLILRMNRSGRLDITSQKMLVAAPELFKRIADAFVSSPKLWFFINISNLSISDEIFTQIPTHFFSEKIQILTMTDQKIGNGGFKYLCNHLSRMKDCFSINLKSNQITDEGIISVLPLLEALETKPITFDLQGNLITKKQELRELTSHLKHKMIF